VTPALNKPGLDETSPSSCRPISNLTVISKLLECLVARQLLAYLDNHHLLPTTPSGFRRGFSTETATIRVLSDLPDAVDRGDTAALVLLDLSAAFDTVDHEILRPHMYVEPCRYVLAPSASYVTCADTSQTTAFVAGGVAHSLKTRLW